MSAARFGLELPGEPGVPEMARLARPAEDLGIESIWLTETRFTRDAVTSAAAVAMATSRTRVATAVINPFTRGAVLTAVTAATLDELAGGRSNGMPWCASTAGDPAPSPRMNRPLAHLRSCVATVRAMLRGEAGPHGAVLDFAPVRAAVPVVLGVTGPQALALAGEIGDGALLNGFLPVEHVACSVAIIRDGAARAGRHPDAIEIAGSTVVSVDPDPARALALARPMVTTYLALFPSIARASGIDPERLERIGAAWGAGDGAAAAMLVEDGDVRRLACVGAPDDVRAALEERRAAGVALPVISFVDPRMHHLLAAVLA
ncbi:MAG: LLM class flavin-dependent oxidoreductase [Chloroflexota bacterium]